MKRYKGAIIALIMIIGSQLVAHAQYDQKAQKILDNMREQYEKTGAFKSDFQYSMAVPDQNVPEEFQGEIIVQGDKFRLKMNGQEIINDGSTVWTYLEDANEVNIDNYSPEEGDISPTQIYNAYQRGFKYNYIGDDMVNGEKSYIVDLTPENTNNQFYKIRLLISQKDNTLKKWQIYEKNGTQYTYLITNFTPEGTLDQEVFTFNKKKHRGVEVVDLR